MSSATGSPAPTARFDHASWLRRIAALCIDWAASSAVAFVILGARGWSDHGGGSWVPLLVFWVESALGVALVGASFGQVLVGIRVHQVDGRPLSLLRALQRQLLVCLVIPPLVFRENGRGLHDLWTHSGAFRARSHPAT